MNKLKKHTSIITVTFRSTSGEAKFNGILNKFSRNKKKRKS